MPKVWVRGGRVGAYVLALLLSVPAGAMPRGPSDVEARRLYAQAKALYARNQFVEALPVFLSAYAVKPMPLLLYNAAQAARRSGKYAQALDLYRRYLLAEPDAPERARCEKYIADLRPYEPPPPAPVVASPPPAPVVVAPVVEPAPTPLVVAQPAPKKKRTALVVGLSAGAVVIVGTALALGLSFGLHPGAPSTSLGTYHPYP